MSGLQPSVYRTIASLPLLLLVACPACHRSPQKAEHRAVGEWHATDRALVFHIFNGGSGSFDERSCTWKQIDKSSIETNCERALVDNAARVFAVTEKNGHEVGILKSSPPIVFIRRDSTQSQALQLETASAQEDDCRSTLEPTWVGRDEATQALGGQVLIAALNTSETSATLRVTFPDSTVQTLSMPVGTRRKLGIDGETYFLDLLDGGSSSVKVSLTKKR